MDISGIVGSPGRCNLNDGGPKLGTNRQLVPGVPRAHKVLSHVGVGSSTVRPFTCHWLSSAIGPALG